VGVRHAVLSIGAVLVLGLGVYLFVEVRSQAEPPAMGPRDTLTALATGAPSPQPARPVVAPPVAPHEVAVPRRSAPLSPVPPAAAPPGPAPLASEPAQQEPELVGPKLDAVMDEANKAYDRGDFDEAKTIAARLLARYPSNVRMLRIMVSASCIDGDAQAAQAHYARLPAPDQAQMRTRCARYGVSFPDKP
jgi:hypothetical protein